MSINISAEVDKNVLDRGTSYALGTRLMNRWDRVWDLGYNQLWIKPVKEKHKY